MKRKPNSFILEANRRGSERRRAKIRRLKKEHQFWRQVALLPTAIMTIYGAFIIVMVIAEEGWDGSVGALSLFVGYMAFELIASAAVPPRDTAFKRCFGEDKEGGNR